MGMRDEEEKKKRWAGLKKRGKKKKAIDGCDRNFGPGGELWMYLEILRDTSLFVVVVTEKFVFLCTAG